ncbi:MAG TPA: hypothetical protein PLU10_07650, partial [Chitinophagaceae bacterium]|nr:hypothetical protein [Chitinophagaceae bacterium]
MRYFFLYLIFVALFIGNQFQVKAKVIDDKLNFNAICIDPHNTVWLGGQQGLYSWNLHKLNKINFADNLVIQQMCEGFNHLFMATNDGRIYTFSLQDQQLKLLFQSPLRISDLMVKDDKLFMATKGNGLFILSAHQLYHFTSANGLNDNYLYKLSASSNEVYISSDNGVNILEKNLSIRRIPQNSVLPDRLATAIAVHDSLLYIGTEKGDLCQLNSHDTGMIIFNKEIWNGQTILDILPLNKTIAIGTTNGCYLLDRNGYLIQKETDAETQHLLVDKEANLWMLGPKRVGLTLGEQLN